ncbi:MAG TPA: UDP-N-acetylmuramoyl-L-alanine--D-glutamate ligase [Candidatus Paceibacterota bacterium]|nr:UDP-N-acetylmuramoyl-L-alanine--D-glutamate ligase [Candidatus Paceibacterota bacterium]
MTSPLKNARVLVMGLGLLGGGAATVNWLIDHGARITVTDLKDAEALAPSVRKVEEHLKKGARDGRDYEQRTQRLTWALGGHTNALVDAAQVLVVNPDVPMRSPYVQRALQRGIPVHNEGTLFYELWKGKTVGITGTRGKTTTATWAKHFIPQSVLTGNSTVKPFLAAADERASVAVTELSSFILEYFPPFERSPRIAVITNLYRDHLNRHGTMQEYAAAKANVFAHQSDRDTLILNADDPATIHFLTRRPKAAMRFFSLSPLPAGRAGVWYQDGGVISREGTREKRVLDIPDFIASWGEHNLANLLAAASASRAAGVPWARIQGRIASLPAVPYRQETVFQGRKLRVINDTTATSPEGGIAAVRRWGGQNCILIAGGTDRELDYREWANEVRTHILKTNLVLLDGSATRKMRRALGPWGRGIRSYASLDDAWQAAMKRAPSFVTAVITFSPAAKSFELFLNEYDRGQQFNALVRRDLG